MRKLGLVVITLVVSAIANGQVGDAVYTIAQSSETSFLSTIETLVAIESGSRDIEGLSEVATLIADRLRALGGDVDVLPPELGADSPDIDHDTVGSMVRARFRGTGSTDVLLIVHMDTVYQVGDAEEQPFRIVDDRAYGLGIADAKQGIATILHTIEILDTLEFREYGNLTVLIT